ncbi:uncharacterized protein LOC141648211 [Silene latifolia]|uniref:uncharacterized protein LOC141648211 n=1 Tax=Silene latifolia TaxID=37657 RepID=UPI003D782971
MIIASWNIRGFNKAVKQVEVVKYLSENKVDILGLLETRVKKNKANRILRNKFRNFDSYCNYQSHDNGRIWLLWNPSTTDITILEEHDQVIHCSVKHLATGREFHLSLVYGSNNATVKHRLWHSLRQAADAATPWAAMGDFNVIRYLHEKVSHISPVLSELVYFNECLLHCGLDEINGSGCEYTWYNKQDAQTRVYTKLDRVLVNDKRKELFVNTSAQFMDPGVSNHSPVLLRFHGDIRPPRRFKFLNCWVDHPDFHKTIAEAWACDVAGNSIFRLMGKLKAVKKKLKLLHSTSFSNITERVKVKQAELAHCYQALQADPHSPALVQKEQAASADFWKLKKIEMSIQSQRAKIQDVKHNDTSTRFFFQKIKERHHQQLIGAIHDAQGHFHQGITKVGGAFVEFYQGLLGSTKVVAPIDPDIFTKGARVDPTDCAKLTSPITRS